MAGFIVWMFTPLVILVILMMALGVIIFNLLYELVDHLLEADKND